jgi:hypothetical protein
MKINPIGHLVKTNPIQTQSNPISSKPKMNANVFVTKDYENETAFRLQKNKTNSNPISVPLVLFIVYNFRKVKIDKEFYIWV